MLSTTNAPYIYERDGIYYFNRRVPKGLLDHYRCSRIVVSLRTKSAQTLVLEYPDTVTPYPEAQKRGRMKFYGSVFKPTSLRQLIHPTMKAYT